MSARLLISVLLVILLSYNVASFGISYEYMENKTLKLYPGQDYAFKLTFQNKDPEDVTVTVSLDSAIATLEGGPELTIPGETFDGYVYFRINVPKTAQPGDVYNINYLVSPVGRGEGQVPIAVRYDRNFKVLVVEKPKELQEQEPAPVPEEPKPGILKWIFLPIILIIIIVVAILLWNKSHQMSGKIMRKESGLSTQRKEIKPLQAIRHEPEPITPPTPVIRTYQRPEQPQPVKQMQEAAPVKKEKAARQEKIISLHHYFHLRNGKSLKSLEELYSEIKAMDHEEYTHHVNHSKNDFANWVLHVLEKPVLAGQLFKTTTKQETLELIKNELDQR